MVKRIGDLEEQLFVSMHDLVFVDKEYLEKYIFVHPDGKTYSDYWIYRQMKALEKEEYVISFPIARASVRGRDRLVYTLGPRGVLEVKEILGEADWDQRWTDRTPTYIYHSLRMGQVQAAFSTHKDEVFSFKEYFSERRAFRNYGEMTRDSKGKPRRSSTTVIRPDGAVVLERDVQEQKAGFLFLVEMERSRQRIDVTLNKIRRYNEYVRKRAYENDTLFGDHIKIVRVLFISNNENERNKLLENARKADIRELEKIGGSVMFATYEDTLANPYGEIWKAHNSTDLDQLYSVYSRIQ
ncbi:replication-relaxation family protein [Priestia koreensis]|uniref:replication-relaxation family protein n=1 Tax=Priestia koreensis TaxID=284581 RepID=UPI00204070EC|nr:replication-relaxation family protein [Priestia koreensis]MCM3006859.1 replication-relaxation family protein [Priestia koreensis]